MGNLLNPSDVGGVVKRYDFAYLMTSTGHGTPHAVAVWPILENGVFIINVAGTQTRDNVAERPLVALVWPPASGHSHSLIVDGKAIISGRSIHISPIRAVLHCSVVKRGKTPAQHSQLPQIRFTANGVAREQMDATTSA